MNAEPKQMENTTDDHHHRSPSQPPVEPNKTQQQPEDDVVPVETVSSGMETCGNEVDDGSSLEGLRKSFQVEKLSEEESGSSAGQRASLAQGVEADDEVKEEAMRVELTEEDDISGREKLKKHRIEVAGRVWIPEIWGQEELLKDWIDCSAFDDSLVPRGLMSARAALVDEGRRANSGGFRIENSSFRIEDAICEVSQNDGAHSGEKLSPALQ